MAGSFEDIQQQEDQMMGAQAGDGPEEELAEAATDLSRTSQQNAHSVNNLTQTVQRVENQISQLTTQMQQLALESSQQNMNFESPQPTGGATGVMEPLQSAGETVGQGAAMAGGMVAGAASQRMNQISQVGGRAFQQEAQPVGAQPGHLEASPSIVGGITQSTGMFWDPSESRGYNFGAYQRAQARAAGHGAQSLMSGAVQGAGSLASAEFLGGIGGAELGGVAGGAAGTALGGPLGGIVGTVAGGALGGIAGSTVGSGLDKVNPIVGNLSNMGQMTQYGAAANQTSYQFLRGRGGPDPGRFGQGEEAEIGAGIQEEMYKELQYGAQELQQTQSQFSRLGLMEGVQTAEEYTNQFSELIDAHKKVSNSLQMSLQEASQFMGTAVNEMGYTTDPTQLANLTTQTRATAHLAGTSPGQVQRMGVRGAQQASQMGMMARSGSQMAMGAAGTAGVSQMLGFRTEGERGVGPNLLASVGGEEGLRQLINRTSQQHMAGTEGDLMAMGGGPAGSYQELLSQASENISGQGDITDFLANRHKKKQDLVDKLGGEGVQAQQLQQYFSLAKRVEGEDASAEELQNMTQVIAQEQGNMSAAEAEAMVESAKTLPETMRRKRQQMAQDRVDTKMDKIMERRSVPGQIQTEFAEATEQGEVPFARHSTGGQIASAPAQAIGGLAGAVLTPGAYQDSETTGGYFRELQEDIGETGQQVQNQVRDFQDWRYGIERQNTSSEDLDRYQESLKEGEIFGDVGTAGTRKNVELQERMGQAAGKSDIMQRYLEEGGDKARAAIVASRESPTGYIDAGPYGGGQEEMQKYLDRVKSGEAGQELSRKDIQSARKGAGVDVGQEGGTFQETDITQEDITERLTGKFGEMEIGGMTDEMVGRAIRSEDVTKLSGKVDEYLDKVRTDSIAQARTDEEKQYEEQIASRFNEMLESGDKAKSQFAKKMLKSGEIEDLEGGVSAKDIRGMEDVAAFGRMSEFQEQSEDIWQQKETKERLKEAGRKKFNLSSEELHKRVGESSTAQWALTGVGGALGMSAGGPVNAALGASAASTAGSYLGIGEGEKKLRSPEELMTEIEERIAADKEAVKEKFKGGRGEKLIEMFDEEKEGFGKQRDEALRLITKSIKGTTGPDVETKEGTPGDVKGAESEKITRDFMEQQIKTMEEIQRALTPEGQ